VIFDLTYSDRAAILRINKELGPPYGLFSRERWTGIGSERLIITGAEGALAEVFEGNFKQNYCNIELRPKGIILHIRYRLEVYACVFPYWKLAIYKTGDEIRFYGDTCKVWLRNYQGQAISQKFIQKMMDAKAAFSSTSDYQSGK
jgi:hypothetical protein